MIKIFSKTNISQIPNRKLRFKSSAGFTLVEIMTAVSVFIVIMLISSGSILSVFDANQKSKSLRSIMDNLNLSLEDMTRTIRFGTVYHCGGSGDLTQPQDCNLGDSITILTSTGLRVTYSLSSGRIVKTVAGVNYSVTSPDVTVTKLDFRVYGSAFYPDLFQPLAIVVISGFVGDKPNSKSTFSLQTTISQRAFDFP